ncbi:MAG: hypothetical protein M1826_003291 [Phylliscum demangeonii]|nr:MAG: hypothetical protein M1826_003291 [Phylliscum demangeonii]
MHHVQRPLALLISLCLPLSHLICSTHARPSPSPSPSPPSAAPGSPAPPSTHRHPSISLARSINNLALLGTTSMAAAAGAIAAGVHTIEHHLVPDGCLSLSLATRDREQHLDWLMAGSRSARQGLAPLGLQPRLPSADYSLADIVEHCRQRRGSPRLDRKLDWPVHRRLLATGLEKCLQALRSMTPAPADPDDATNHCLRKWTLVATPATGGGALAPGGAVAAARTSPPTNRDAFSTAEGAVEAVARKTWARWSLAAARLKTAAAAAAAEAAEAASMASMDTTLRLSSSLPRRPTWERERGGGGGAAGGVGPGKAEAEAEAWWAKEIR